MDSECASCKNTISEDNSCHKCYQCQLCCDCYLWDDEVDMEKEERRSGVVLYDD